jgi:hypothetical protein
VTDTTPEGQVSLTISWTGVDEQPVYSANQFAAQVQGIGSGPPEEILLTVGHLGTPLFIGPDQEAQIREFVSAGNKVPVRTLFRVAVTKSRAQELVSLLTNAIEQLENSQEEGSR